MGMGRRGVSFLEDWREWRLPSFFYADDLVLRGESEEDLRRWWDGLLRCVGVED